MNDGPPDEPADDPKEDEELMKSEEMKEERDDSVDKKRNYDHTSTASDIPLNQKTNIATCGHAERTLNYLQRVQRPCRKRRLHSQDLPQSRVL